MPEDKHAEVLNKNKHVARSLIEHWNRKGESHIPAGHGHSALVTRIPEPVGSPEAAKRGTHKAGPAQPVLPREAFPDQKFQEEIVLAENDLVFIGWSVTGTNTGPLYGKPPTGKQVTVYGADAFRMADGKIVEHWPYHAKARLSALAKLGLLDNATQDSLCKQGFLTHVCPH